MYKYIFIVIYPNNDDHFEHYNKIIAKLFLCHLCRPGTELCAQCSAPQGKLCVWVQWWY